MDVSQLEIIAPMIFVVVLTLTVGGVVLLRPISKHLGNLLEAMASEKRQPQAVVQIQRMNGVLDTISARRALLEERQDFTDALLHDPGAQEVSHGRRCGLGPGPRPVMTLRRPQFLLGIRATAILALAKVDRARAS